MIGKLVELDCVHLFDGRPGKANRKIDLAEALGRVTIERGVPEDGG
jgi:hypothetical protein